MTTNSNERTVRLKIDKFLEDSGWILPNQENKKENVKVEPSVTYKDSDKTGSIDYVLLDKEGKWFGLIEAKASDKHPLVGKEQARQYSKATNTNFKFIILSNGSLHFFWDLTKKDNQPFKIEKFPTPENLEERTKPRPNSVEFTDFEIDEYMVAESMEPKYSRDVLIEKAKSKNLPILRDYQLEAVKTIQKLAPTQNRFLLEMATGTGKTLVAAAIIKMFLKTHNTKRVLFLVDRIELENQAANSFKKYFDNEDWRITIYKDGQTTWQNCEIVISTVQSLYPGQKYKKIFFPFHFDFLIVDEAHRTIAGTVARPLFDYFEGYKLGLTATPKDYLKNFVFGDNLTEKENARLIQRRLRDTFETFGCLDHIPTFSFSHQEAVKQDYLVKYTAIDVQTNVIEQLYSKNGLHVTKVKDSQDPKHMMKISPKDFERTFFSSPTLELFSEKIIENSLKDPINNEIGKTLIFTISQNYASKLTAMLNKKAALYYPGKYDSDFAVQITSNVPNSAEMADKFAKNTLNGNSRWKPNYKTSKTRICVTVSMMTTGYDCRDLLNIIYLKSIRSPVLFLQIRGRGTRTFTFKDLDSIPELKIAKSQFQIMDFFGNIRYFNNEYDYDQVLKLPSINKSYSNLDEFEKDVSIESANEKDFEKKSLQSDDHIFSLNEQTYNFDNPMKMDSFDEKFANYEANLRGAIKNQDELKKEFEDGDPKNAYQKMREYLDASSIPFSRPYISNLLKLQQTPTLKETFVWLVYGAKLKNLDEKINDTFSEYFSYPGVHVDKDNYGNIRNFFGLYYSEGLFRDYYNDGKMPLIPSNFHMSLNELFSIPVEERAQIVKYIDDLLLMNKENSTSEE